MRYRRNESARKAAAVEEHETRKMRPGRYLGGLVSLGLACNMLMALEGHAQTVVDFYAGRTINVYIGFSAGGAYDIYARQLARFMGSHLPGHPTLVPQNMTGAGGLTLANFLYNVAPKDGTAIATFGRGLLTTPLLGTGARYDSTKFFWLGSVASESDLCAVWSTSPIAGWDDMMRKDFVMGGTGPSADSDAYSAVLKNMFGAKLKLVSGYPGGNELNIAMERGEIDGRCGWSWSAIKTTNPSWIDDKKIRLLVQMGLSKEPELPDVPWIMDFAANDRDRQILDLVLARQTAAWPFMAPPGLPEDRKAALRQAFDDTMRDPGFLAETKNSGLTVKPVGGDKIDALIAELYRIPKDVVDAARIAQGVDAR
jgi:tripartite-type tricarboxylate transporter receptor subunit TctC